MSAVSLRNLTPAEKASITRTLRALREHYHLWPHYEGREHDLVGFAFYEGCGRAECCGVILAKAAPFALGKELVTRHGFQWVMITSGRSLHYGVTHPALDRPIDLASLEDSSWNLVEYDLPPPPGRITNDSLETIAERVQLLK